MSGASIGVSDIARAGASCVPWWRETALAISQNNNSANIFNISSSASFRYIAPYPGRVLGLGVYLDVVISAGQLDVEVHINNTEVGQISLTSASPISQHSFFATALSFAAGETIDVRYSSDGLLAGATAFIAIPTMLFDG